jgi:catechol-2,3-dioxygenase
MTLSNPRPALGGLRHLAITVSDVEASAEWYERVLGAWVSNTRLGVLGPNR